MKFFGRDEELRELKRIRDLSVSNSRFTVITGRRRVGKTELIERAFGDGTAPYLYFLVTNRAERELCGILQEEMEKVLEEPILGRAERFSQLLEIVMKASLKGPLTLVIDEFQEFDKINPAIFGEIQGVWDRLHKKSKINLVVCGSVNRMMHKIFFDDSQPLYGRNTGSLRLDPFSIGLLKEIHAAHCPKPRNVDLLTLWTLTGGVARYVEYFMDNGAVTRSKMIRQAISLGSSYINEGKAILSEEFGKDYGIYFSILSAIAAGKTSYAEIRNEIGTEVGGQITRLEKSYQLISKVQPFGEKSATKNCLYRIDDCFFRFWFRFIYKYQHLIEQKMFDELVSIVERDLDAFSGFALERYFRQKFIEEHRYTKVGGWWDRRGENEIDLVCENELTSALDFYEVKLDASRISLDELERKRTAFFEKNPQLRTRSGSCCGLSLADM